MPLFLILLALFISTAYAEDIDYEKVFSSDYESAVNRIETLKPFIHKECHFFHTDPAIASAVVFPELIRASILRDRIESFGLSMLYVNNGNIYADFSSGIFQMKPSFLEAIEQRTLCDKRYSDFITIFSYPPGLSEKEQRRERIERIASNEWQCRYLAFFMYVVINEFPVEKMSKTDRVLFISTAYNSGFLKKYEDIERAVKTEMFPYGRGVPFRQYAYSEVALWYYIHASRKKDLHSTP